MKGDTRTADLLAWAPPEVVQTFAPDQVRAASLRAQVSRAVAAALRDCDTPRDEIAAAMGAYLGEPVPKTALDGYASEAREDHTISVLRLMALVHATGDVRLLQMLAEPFHHMVVDARHQEAIEEIIDLDRRDEVAEYLDGLERRIEARRRRRRGGHR
ncbi:DNA transposition protein [Roseospira navarrensis]|nr:DNA transposition protein [Roseospira navarrensis]